MTKLNISVNIDPDNIYNIIYLVYLWVFANNEGDLTPDIFVNPRNYVGNYTYSQFIASLKLDWQFHANFKTEKNLLEIILTSNSAYVNWINKL